MERIKLPVEHEEIPAIKVVHYANLQPCLDAFIDTRTPGSDQKENFTIIGPGVSENPNQHVHIARPHGFNIGGARQPPGCVNSQHSHDTAEFFYVHTGTWTFDLGETGEDASIMLRPGDAISIPTRLFRGFKNVGEDCGFLFAVLGGDEPGRVMWAPYVFDMAEQYGLILLDNGSLIDTAKGESVPPGAQPMPRTSRAQVDALQRFDEAALRECCVLRDDSVPGDAAAGIVRRRIVHPQGALNWPHEFAVEEVRMEAGAVIDLGEQAANQVVFGQSGRVCIASDPMACALGPGDTATIARGRSRRVENRSDQPATLLVITATQPPAAH